MKRIVYILVLVHAFALQMWGQSVSDIRSSLDALLSEADRAQYNTGLVVYDLTADSMVCNYNGNKLMRPASNQKLFTAISALSLLGPNHEYRTVMCHTGSVVDSVLRGDVYVIGDFDPMLAYSDLKDMSRRIQSLGIKRIEGKIYADVSMKDTLAMGSGWCWDDVPDDTFPYLSPLSFNRGCATVEVRGGKGRFVVPTSYMEIVNKGGSGSLVIDRDWQVNSNTFVVSGNGTGSATLNVYHPDLYFVCTLTDLLREEGVTFASARPYGIAECPSRDTVQLMTLTHTIGQVLQRMMKKSDNLYAETMFYQLANEKARKGATRKEAAEQMTSVLIKAGGNADQIEIADGSGVSLYDYITPEAQVLLLKYAYANRTMYDWLYPSLPIAGVDGTLKSRMTSGTAYRNVHAKTGTVRGTSCLSGYLTAANGHVLAFSIMNNGLHKSAVGRDFQDRVCQALSKAP